MNRYFWLLFLLLALTGIFLRVRPSVTYRGPGADEHFYARYVELLGRDGVLAYPALVRKYVAEQKRPEVPLVLPPLRITFLLSAHLFRQISGSSALSATHAVACAASIVLLFLSGVFAWRLGGSAIGLGVFALMAFAPMQIYTAQRALIDGFFTLWALLAVWALWENLQKPRHTRWLSLYGIALALMVLTKENAFFVYLALGGILLAARPLKLGQISWPLLLVTVAAPACAVLVLVLAAGGVTEFIEVYRTNVQKSVVSPYAIETGDGPWQRYLLDLLMVDPLVLLLAVGAVFHLKFNHKPAIYLSLFVGLTYLVMSQVRYGMNLRYANIWDMPLRYLACSLLLYLTSWLSRRHQVLVVAGLVGALCLEQWQQYHLFFVEAGIYDPVPSELGQALDLLK